MAIMAIMAVMAGVAEQTCEHRPSDHERTPVMTGIPEPELGPEIWELQGVYDPIESTLFRGFLRKFRDVEYVGLANRAEWGGYVTQYSVACPVSASHRMIVFQIPGGVVCECNACSTSPERVDRLGHNLAKRLGVVRCP